MWCFSAWTESPTAYLLGLVKPTGLATSSLGHLDVFASALCKETGQALDAHLLGERQLHASAESVWATEKVSIIRDTGCRRIQSQSVSESPTGRSSCAMLTSLIVTCVGFGQGNKANAETHRPDLPGLAGFFKLQLPAIAALSGFAVWRCPKPT